MKTIIVQPSEQGGKLPYPYFVAEDGSVGRQDFWRGAPLRVLGFQESLRENRVDLDWDEAWAEPTLAVGMYLVTEDANGQISTHAAPIAGMHVHDPLPTYPPPPGASKKQPTT